MYCSMFGYWFVGQIVCVAGICVWCRCLHLPRVADGRIIETLRSEFIKCICLFCAIYFSTKTCNLLIFFYFLVMYFYFIYIFISLSDSNLGVVCMYILCVCVCVCVCVCGFMWFMRTQICIITWVWQRYYNLKVFYEDTAYVPVIQKA